MLQKKLEEYGIISFPSIPPTDPPQKIFDFTKIRFLQAQLWQNQQQFYSLKIKATSTS